MLFFTAQSEIIGESQEVTLDLLRMFQDSPIIYSCLLLLSVLSFVLWLYSLMTLRLDDMVPAALTHEVKELLTYHRFDDALQACQLDKSFAAQVMACGIANREQGAETVVTLMHSEGKRCSSSLWQRLSLLNDVAIVAPMLGLLGTVLGMFYAFYDTGHSSENLTAIFDGLGIAIGTTVAGLVVAIVAMVFYTTLKFRVTKIFNVIEREVFQLIPLLKAHNKGTSE